MLSVAIITKNEEERLPDCLKSVHFADDVAVIDSESTDQTVAIAKNLGARIFIEPWKGYARQKQSAVDHCLHDWVLILDADERIPPETAMKISTALKNVSAETAAFGFNRKNILHGKWIKHCGWYPDRIVRLVHRKNGAFDERYVHESWHTRGKVTMLDADIEHISFRNYSEMIAKMDHYSGLAAKEFFKNKKPAHCCSPLFHGLWMFFRTYFMEWGCLEGFDGFMIATLNAGGSFLKYAKLIELIQKDKKKDTFFESPAD
ncbi:MAG: glycosyltransferase family 2 protein [Desulfobacteraceae bacterium]|nr:MAG: glycosyltransferase family 2 protein [Desulfobacteraceae bacterium]